MVASEQEVLLLPQEAPGLRSGQCEAATVLVRGVSPCEFDPDEGDFGGGYRIIGPGGPERHAYVRHHVFRPFNERRRVYSYGPVDPYGYGPGWDYGPGVIGFYGPGVGADIY